MISVAQKKYNQTEKRRTVEKRYRQSEKGRTSNIKRQKRYNQSKKGKLARKKRDQMCKDIMKQLKINGCAICGYKKCNRALAFHHVNPDDKKYNITWNILTRKTSVIIDELNKCILLCFNCHNEIEGVGTYYDNIDC